MRIISGTAGGIMLQVPKGEVRPTTDRVREALFSILGSRVDKASVLDLFAGSGAFGLEALSRGASSAAMVDASRTSCAIIRKNMEKARLSRGSALCSDALAWVRREKLVSKKYDIIFADPPYCKGSGDRDFIRELACEGLSELLAPGGVFIAEAQDGWGIASGEERMLEGFFLWDTRKYGKNVIMIYGNEENPS